MVCATALGQDKLGPLAPTLLPAAAGANPAEDNLEGGARWEAKSLKARP